MDHRHYYLPYSVVVVVAAVAVVIVAEGQSIQPEVVAPRW